MYTCAIRMAKKEKQIKQPTNMNKKKFKGVRMRSWGSWVSEIRAPNQKTRIWLGSHSTAEAAARAYDAASVCLRGSSATLNFPNFNYYIPDSVPSPRSIQRIATAAADSSPSQAVDCHVSSTNVSPAIVEHPSETDGYASLVTESLYAFDEITLHNECQYEESLYDNYLVGADDNYDGGEIRLWSFND